MTQFMADNSEPVRKRDAKQEKRPQGHPKINQARLDDVRSFLIATRRECAATIQRIDAALVGLKRHVASATEPDEALNTIVIEALNPMDAFWKHHASNTTAAPQGSRP